MLRIWVIKMLMSEQASGVSVPINGQVSGCDVYTLFTIAVIIGLDPTL